MPFWVRPFTMSLPGTAADVLTAVASVDPNVMYGEKGLLHPGLGLEIQVVGNGRIEANLWTNRGTGNRRGPVLRAAVRQEGTSARIEGTLSWSRMVLAVLFLPLLIPALVLAMCLRDSVWPGWHNFLFAVLGLGGMTAAFVAVGAVRWPKRAATEEQDLRDALLRDLVRPGADNP